MFTRPQVTLYARDVGRLVEFYTGLGFTELFRFPAHPDPPDHVELGLDGFNLGVASAAAAARDHGLAPNPGGGSAELVFWTDDTDGEYARLVAAGAPSLSAPHDWLDSLRIAWVADPEGTPIQLVQRRDG